MKIAKFKIEEWMNKYESSALYDLTTTCIKPLSINELCDSIPNEVLEKQLGYGDITGSLRLKKAIQSLYENVKIDNITVTHGAIGANQLVFLSMLEKRDEVISIIPTYQQHYSIPESIGSKVYKIFLKEENNWLPDLSEIESVISTNTTLITLNNPNNPTGSVIPEEMMEEIIKLARKYNVWILCDEVYRGLNLNGKPYSKSIVDMYEKGISVGSMSKTYSLPGLRVGWVASRADLIEAINKQRQYNTISVSYLDDYFASVALEQRSRIETRNRIIQHSGIEILKKWLKCEPKMNCILPSGGTTALVKYKNNIPSAELCAGLQNATGVALLPGETMEMEGYVRIGFCAENLEKALVNISNYINSPLIQN